MRAYWWGGLVVLALWPSAARAQTRVGLEVGAERFWGVAREREFSDSYVGPYRPLTLGLRAERHLGPLVVSAALRYSEAALIARRETFALVDDADPFQTLAVEAGLNIRAVRLTDGVTLRAGAGPLLEHWSLGGEDGTTRLGVVAGPGLEIGLGGRLTGLIEARLGATPVSVLHEDAVPEEVERRATWRRTLRGVLLFRL